MFGRFCVFVVCPVCALTFQGLDLETFSMQNCRYMYTFVISRSSLYIKLGHRVKVKVTGAKGQTSTKYTDSRVVHLRLRDNLVRYALGVL